VPSAEPERSSVTLTYAVWPTTSVVAPTDVLLLVTLALVTDTPLAVDGSVIASESVFPSVTTSRTVTVKSCETVDPPSTAVGDSARSTVTPLAAAVGSESAVVPANTEDTISAARTAARTGAVMCRWSTHRHAAGVGPTSSTD